jgi:uncharacterized protein
VVRFHTVGFVLTLIVACGSGPPSPKTAPVEPPPQGVTARTPIDADVLEPPPEPPKLVCDGDTQPTPAPLPEPTWYCARADGTRHGNFVTLYPDGSVAARGRYKDGVLDGAWQRFHVGGAVAEDGSFTAGQKDGHWKELAPNGTPHGEYVMSAGSGIEKHWLDDGTLYSEISRKAGTLDGPYKIYAPDGTVIVSARYVKGKLDGPHEFGTRATVRFEEKFVNGARHGPRQIWQFNSLTADETFRYGRYDGPYTLWRSYSRRIPRVKGQFASGKRDGTWTWTDRDNKKEREGEYIAGKKHGLWQEWLDDKLVFSGNYSAGRPDGDFVYYDRSGNELGKFSISDGTGTMLTFWGNRKVASKQRLYKGTPDGRYEEFTNKGKRVVDARYAGGVRHGTWKELTPEGVVTLEQHWKKGKLDGVTKKLVDGKVSAEFHYVDAKAQGPYTEFRNGKPSVTGQFTADRKSGTWTYYNADGAVSLQATYKDGVLDGPYHQLVDGYVVEGTMSQGRRTGTWTRTDKAGAVRKITYKTP